MFSRTSKELSLEIKESLLDAKEARRQTEWAKLQAEAEAIDRLDKYRPKLLREVGRNIKWYINRGRTEAIINIPDLMGDYSIDLISVRERFTAELEQKLIDQGFSVRHSSFNDKLLIVSW